MSRGTRQQQSQHNNNSGSGSSASQQSVQNSNNNTNIRRGNKTLGWYLGELVPSQSGGGNGNADEANNENNAHNHHQHQMLSGQRKGSLAEESSARCSPKAANRAEDHHHHRNGNNNHNNSTRPSHHHHQNAHSNGNNNMRYRHAHHSAVRSRANSSASASKKPMTASNQSNNNNGPANQHSGPSKDHQQSQQQQQQGSAATDFHRSGGGGGRGVGGKENYWYYDPVSDGYYYEHNGTRGWRKRNARLDAAVHAAQMRGIEEAQQKLEQQKKLAESKAQQQQQQQQQNVPSLMAAQQLAKLAAPNGNVAPPFGSPMAIKYFDHEGYFYEMASVDGWRRRPPGTTPPNSLASSFGTQPKAPSPIPAGPPALPQRRKVQPLQYQAYQQPPPQLSSALDFQEMLLLAKQQQQHGGGGHRSSAAASAAHGGSCCAQAAQCCANSAPTCCCTIAAMAAQLVLQKQQQFQLMESMKGGGGGGGAEFGGIGDCCGDHSSELGKSNVRSLLDGISKKATAPKPASYATKEDFTVNNNNHNNRFELSRSSLGTGWQFPRENGAKWNPMGIGAAAKAGCADERTTTALAVGSFEEPYEFYSSGDEASSETAPPNPTIMPLALAATLGAHQQNHNGSSVNNNNTTAVTTAAASVSSVDEDDRLLEELMMFESGQQRQQPSIAPIGSEALAMMGKAGAEQKRTRAQKRPDSLRLTCPKPIGTVAAYEPISPGEILHKTTAANGKENSQAAYHLAAAAHNNFDVDKFIANLPPMPVNHHESILHQMRNPLRTPMGGAPPLVTEPSTADSPLFTPIFLGKNPWAYRAPENPWAYP